MWSWKTISQTRMILAYFPKVQKLFTNLNDILIEPFFSVSDLVYQLLQIFFFYGYKSIKLKLLARENQTVGKPWTKTQKIGNSRSFFSYRKEKRKLHTPCAGITLFRFKGTFSACSQATPRFSRLAWFKHPWCFSCQFTIQITYKSLFKTSTQFVCFY